MLSLVTKEDIIGKHHNFIKEISDLYNLDYYEVVEDMVMANQRNLKEKGEEDYYIEVGIERLKEASKHILNELGQKNDNNFPVIGEEIFYVG